jgi:hypothetical protein
LSGGGLIGVGDAVSPGKKE